MRRDRHRQPETEADLRKSRKGNGHGPRRLFVFLSALVLGGLSGGFFAFAHYVDGLSVPEQMPDADGVVVWTGPGGGRLEEAGRLIEAGHGERLLVSGVNRSLTLESVARLTLVSETTANCCLDLDYAALDTRGNARETAAWAQALGFDHVILVTSSYHMPRAIVELRHEMAGLRITPVAVQASNQVDWWTDTDRFRRLAGEYGKYLLSLARGRSTDRNTALDAVPAPDMPDANPVEETPAADDNS